MLFRMTFLIGICFLVSAYQSTAVQEQTIDYHEMFLKYIKNYSKIYSSGEIEVRYEIFKNNVLTIEEHNLMYRAGKSSFFRAINQFTDLTQFEFNSLYLTYTPTDTTSRTIPFVPHGRPNAEELDWRTEGKVNAVKNQGACGSCWAFGSLSAVETAYAIKYKKLLSFSEQQLVDCVTEAAGCNGGSNDVSFNYQKKNGICTTTDYPTPYEAKQGNCSQNNCTAQTKLVGYSHMIPKSALSFVTALNKGAVSIGIDASDFSTYGGGIVDQTSKCGHDRDHAMTIVGYGYDTKEKENYYIVRNSWGPGWGESGYMRIKRGGNYCDVEADGTQPHVA